jgi:putative Mg2+ transporter-C (MgtC) family protein
VFGHGRHAGGPRLLTSNDVEAQYTVEIACRGAEEAHMRSLLLHALSQAGLGLRRIESEDIPDTSKVTVTAQAVTARRNDAALEQIVGRLSLEPNVSAATWQIDRTIPEA